jgi:hypothetical protein
VIYLKNEIVEVNGVLYKALKDSVDAAGNIIIPTISEEWQSFWEIFTVRLPYVPAAGQKINIYIKRKDTNITVRVDDENYIQYGVDGSSILDSSTGTNPTAEIPTFVGNGVTDIIQIGQYLLVNDGDTLIFRPEESDGSVSITDENILDTKLSGGSLSAISAAYVTAIGTTAEEILISGGKFIDKENVPAPEENIPGQVIDSVSIKVYNNKISGAASLQSKITTANGQDTVFDVGQTVLENSSIFVYVDNTAKILGQHYTIDFTAANVDFISAPAAGDWVEILSIGIGGVGILDYQSYVADGTTGLFLTNAGYDITSAVFVTLNGSPVDIGFRNSTDIIDICCQKILRGRTPLSTTAATIVDNSERQPDRSRESLAGEESASAVAMNRERRNAAIKSALQLLANLLHGCVDAQVNVCMYVCTVCIFSIY